MSCVPDDLLTLWDLTVFGTVDHPSLFPSYSRANDSPDGLPQRFDSENVFWSRRNTFQGKYGKWFFMDDAPVYFGSGNSQFNEQTQIKSQRNFIIDKFGNVRQILYLDKSYSFYEETYQGDQCSECCTCGIATVPCIYRYNNSADLKYTYLDSSDPCDLPKIEGTIIPFEAANYLAFVRNIESSYDESQGYGVNSDVQPDNCGVPSMGDGCAGYSCASNYIDNIKIKLKRFNALKVDKFKGLAIASAEKKQEIALKNGIHNCQGDRMCSGQGENGCWFPQAAGGWSLGAYGPICDENGPPNQLYSHIKQKWRIGINMDRLIKAKIKSLAGDVYFYYGGPSPCCETPHQEEGSPVIVRAVAFDTNKELKDFRKFNFNNQILTTHAIDLLETSNLEEDLFYDLIEPYDPFGIKICYKITNVEYF